MADCLSLFTGAGGFDLGLQAAGFALTASLELDGPCQATLRAASRHDMLFEWDLGDQEAPAQFASMRVVEPEQLRLIAGGPPCFPAEVLVMTVQGPVPISDVKVGDLVLTHKDRYRKVLAVGGKRADLIKVKGQGHFGLPVTPDHPFLISRRSSPWDSIRRTNYRVFGEPEWMPVGLASGHYWTHNLKFPVLPIPQVESSGREKSVSHLSEDFFWLVGFWLAEGWVRLRSDKKSGEVFFACNKRELVLVKSKFKSVGLAVGECDDRGSVLKLRCCSRPLAKWLVNNFGRRATGKTVPGWVLGMDHHLRSSLLAGYSTGDGSDHQSGRQHPTVSKRLAIGMKMLMHSLGHAVSISRIHPSRGGRRGTCVIEGRQVRENPSFLVRYATSSRSSQEAHGYRLGLIRKIESLQADAEVYNLEVEEDNSYTADGVIVHNCQAFSTAGKREGAADARGLLVYRFLDWVTHFRPQWFVFENVKGLASASLMHRAVKDRPPNGPPLTQYEEKGSLLDSMLGQLPCEYRVDGYLLNAADFGVPQFRERMFFFGNRLDMKVEWPQPTHGIPGVPHRTLRDAIWHLRGDPGEGVNFSERQKGILKDVPPGGNWRSLPAERRDVWGRGMSKDGGNTGWWRRLSWDQPSPTILTQPNHSATCLCHPDETRPLSLAECAAIQGFPPGYPFQGKLADKYRQVGNAVPVGLGEAVGRAILAAVPAEKYEHGWTVNLVRPNK